MGATQTVNNKNILILRKVIDWMEVAFVLGGIAFEYDEEKNQRNIKKHGISFKNAARVFFDYDRVELYDEENSSAEDRYNVIGDLSAGSLQLKNSGEPAIRSIDGLLFVVYTERVKKIKDGQETEVIRIISARFATSFERGLYYGKYE